jgi:hypothetical protein
MGTAGMYIENDGKEYLLTPVDTVPGYYVCLDTSMVVEADKDYILTFDHNGTEVSAATTVPPKPQDLSLSDIYYYYDPYGSLPGYTDPLEVYWDNTDGAYYQIVVEYLDETYKPISEYLDPNSYDSYRVIASGALSGDTYSLMPRRHERCNARRPQHGNNAYCPYNSCQSVVRCETVRVGWDKL